MRLNVTLVGLRETVAAFNALPAAVGDAVRREIQKWTLRLQAHVVEDFLSGQVLHVRTGALRRSIQQEVTQEGAVTIGRVFSAGDVKYAGIHEFGGVIHHPGGTAYFVDSGGGLAVFIANDDPRAAYLPRTKPHDIPMPARPFMRPALADLSEQIIEGVRAAAIAAAESVGLGAKP